MKSIAGHYRVKFFVLVIHLLLIVNFNSSAQPCKKVFENAIAANSKLIKCGANYTMEKTKDDVFIFKKYFTGNYQVTKLAEFKTKEFEILHGRYEERYDDGTIVVSGIHDNGIKVGQWQERNNIKGLYINGYKNGKWKITINDSIAIKELSYLNDTLHGTQIYRDSMGVTLYEETYEHGNLIHTTFDSTNTQNLIMPRFPGCEDENLPIDAVRSCATNKMLRYVYTKLRYPPVAREKGIEGMALAQFIVNKEGKIKDLKILNGLSPDIKRSVTELIEKMPTWVPGTKNNKPVDVMYTLPVKFRLE